MDDSQLIAHSFASWAAFLRTFDGASEGARVIDRDGVVAAVTPATPDRAVMNSVVPRDGAALERAYDDIAAAYAEAGVRAWTVWIHERDADAARLLEERGHFLDSTPRTMGCELSGFEAPAPPDGFGLGDGATVDRVMRINDAAYGWPPENGFAHGLSGWRVGHARLYLDSTESSCVVVGDHDGDCGVYLVATLPEARGRGLAGALLARALVDARERGCAVTTLHATSAGAPLYTRLGYRDLGPAQMWELRRE